MMLFLEMNYLAHAFLSFNNPDILTGNIISDFVKGKAKFNFPDEIQKGISLHRSIDEFTDNHSVTSKAKSFFRPAYRLYSGAFTDVVYDHFLARDDKQFAEYKGLENFARDVYHSLEKEYSLFPPRFQKIFPYMKSQNWLYGYRFREGIQKSFQGLAFRAAYLNESAIAFEIFNQYYSEFENCYEEFFPELKQFASYTLSNLLAE